MGQSKVIHLHRAQEFLQTKVSEANYKGNGLMGVV